MKRKTKIILLTAIIVITIALTVWVGGMNMNPFKNMNAVDITEITIHNPTKYYTITEKEDIQILFDSLQSMNLRKKLKSNKDGFAFLIEIKFKNGETIDMSILSKNIRIKNIYYKPDNDYCNRVLKIFNSFSEKYKNYPS